MTCVQPVIVERQITCFWKAQPPAPFYEVLFSKSDGSEIFRMNSSEKAVSAVIANSVGNTIMVGLRNASAKIEIFGMSINHFTLSVVTVLSTFTLCCHKLLGSCSMFVQKAVITISTTYTERQNGDIMPCHGIHKRVLEPKQSTYAF